jgi:hypothetical protein
VRNLQAVVELGARRALHAMIRPQNLLPIRERDGLERAPAGMGRCKRVVAGRVPILRPARRHRHGGREAGRSDRSRCYGVLHFEQKCLRTNMEFVQ